MKQSKIVLGSLLLISVLGVACDKYKGLPPQTENVSPSVALVSPSGGATLLPIPSGNGFNVVQTPRPFGAEDKSPVEPSAYQTSAPFIIGRSPSPFGAGLSSSAAPIMAPIVPGKVSGVIYGYDPSIRSYRVLSNAKVYVGSTSLVSDSGGRYTTSEDVTTSFDLTATAEKFMGSTVARVVPGENRDIHLQALDNRQKFNSNTITSEIISLDAQDPEVPDYLPTSASASADSSGSATPIPAPSYPSLLSFGDKEGSRFLTTVLDPVTGRIRVEVNPVHNKTTAEGKLFIYELERDSSGKPTNPTQMKKFIKKDIVFRVGDNKFPGVIVPAEDTTTKTDEDINEKYRLEQEFLLKNFVNINVKFHDSFGFSNFSANAYVVFPTGEKVLVSKYAGGVPTSLSFRMPKLEVDQVSYTIEAHAGNSSLGSDVVITDMRANDSAEVYLLQPPSGLTPNYETSGTVTPNLNWSSIDQAKAYQVELKSTNSVNPWGWEGFSDTNALQYPSAIPLKLNDQYTYQVMALDFNPGGLNVLSNKAESMRYRVMKTNSKDMPFKIMLATQNGKLPKGYRVSYNTVSFRAK